MSIDRVINEYFQALKKYFQIITGEKSSSEAKRLLEAASRKNIIKAVEVYKMYDDIIEIIEKTRGIQKMENGGGYF